MLVCFMWLGLGLALGAKIGWEMRRVMALPPGECPSDPFEMRWPPDHVPPLREGYVRKGGQNAPPTAEQLANRPPPPAPFRAVPPQPPFRKG